MTKACSGDEEIVPRRVTSFILNHMLLRAQTKTRRDRQKAALSHNLLGLLAPAAVMIQKLCLWDDTDTNLPANIRNCDCSC